MSCTTFIAACMAKPTEVLIQYRDDPAKLEKAAAQHGISVPWATEYLNREVQAR